MSQPTQSSQNKKLVDTAVLIALIGAAATIIAAIIAIIPSIIPPVPPTPVPATPPPVMTATKPADTSTSLPTTPVTPTATSVQPANSSTPAPPNSNASPVPDPPSGYPCEATVNSWRSGMLNVVRDFPNPTALLRDPIQSGTAVRILEISGSEPPWYRIASLEGRVLGWIPDEYLTLSATCPRS